MVKLLFALHHNAHGTQGVPNIAVKMQAILRPKQLIVKKNTPGG
jgi:hypothetical protein